ncbi:hypothetical protein ITP53_36120 [Nonomuraea sp. K274]|uniref:Methylamine utilisation protein MauE domain-containing protein n=1 Tax=Nonomuraea cypriaca TaxID=1187855 RepID=A0A931F203_9ACTN|nr:MauE/DoxX family redox-associated membrane protein [Nonomuraea cypriaca]MBF8191045.1 hypothetical protein [Nonomuraea cypriaca]
MSEFMRVFPPVLLVVVFTASSLAKVSRAEAFRSFAASIHALRIVPARGVTATAGVVVAVEIVTTGLLLTPWSPAGLVLAASALAVFAVVAVVTRRRGLAVPCNCFGPGPRGRRGGSFRGAAVEGRGRPLGIPHAVRNTILAGVAVAGLPAGPLGIPDSEAGWVGAGLAGAAALVCATVVLRFEDVVALFGQAPGASGVRGPRSARRPGSLKRPSPETAP